MRQSNVLQILKLTTVLLFVPHGFLRGAELTLTLPKDYQVIQRTTREHGMVRITGHFSETPPTEMVIEARMLAGTPDVDWHSLHANIVGQTSMQISKDSQEAGTAWKFEHHLANKRLHNLRLSISVSANDSSLRGNRIPLITVSKN